MLVHGAWADGSCWQNVVLPLQRQGLRVTAAPIPLTSLTDDVAALRRVLERASGPVVLVGHAYAGAVIAAAPDDRVRALVFIAALAPDEGETVAQMFYRAEPHPSAPRLAPDARGFIWMPEEGFRRAVAHEASTDQAAILAAVQRPIAVTCIQEQSPAPAWKTTPSWFLVAERDRMINPDTPAIHGRPDARDRPPARGGSLAHVVGASHRRRRDRRRRERGVVTMTATKKIASVAVVTGASQGIGRATALRLARDFSAIVLVARNQAELRSTASDVMSASAEPLVCALDLREPRAADAVVEQTLERFGRIDALLNIAGAVPQIDLFEMTDAQWEDGMALKLHGARRLTIRAWDALKAARGSVVLISGSAALDPRPGFAAVAATNAAISALAKAFAEQGIKDGVQVNSVVPGPVMTGRRRSFLEKWAPAHDISVR